MILFTNKFLNLFVFGCICYILFSTLNFTSHNDIQSITHTKSITHTNESLNLQEARNQTGIDKNNNTYNNIALKDRIICFLLNLKPTPNIIYSHEQ